MSTSYVDRRDDAYWIAGTRVSLDSIVYAFRDGQTPEGISQAFPSLSLEQVYGAVAFYLANRTKVDAYLEQGEAEYQAFREATREADPPFHRKLAAARKQLVTAP